MTVRCTLSALASSISIAILLVVVSPISAQVLPDGPGKAETEKVCSKCHELSRSVSQRQSRDGWEVTIDKMVSFGAEASDKELDAIADYLSKNFSSAALPKLNVNKAEAIEFESRLSLPRSQAAAIVEYRTKNGNFKTIEDLKKVPGVDAAKIEAKKDKIAF